LGGKGRSAQTKRREFLVFDTVQQAGKPCKVKGDFSTINLDFAVGEKQAGIYTSLVLVPVPVPAAVF